MVKPRPARSTVKCVDSCCELYKGLFVEVRAYECFKHLHVGLISELKRKGLPAIAKVVEIENEQGLLHFLTDSPWQALELEKRRLEITLNVLEGREIIVIIDETGDIYQTKPELGAELVRELKELGFNIKRVLADCFYGESHSNFIVLGAGQFC